MDCARCGKANRAAARFCGGCGGALAPRCPACGVESESGAQFCDACGTSLVARAADEAVARKVVSIVFADLVGSTALHERLDAESARRLMDRYYRALHAAVEAHGGTVVKLLGDGVMAAFGVRHVGEDDAIRAVRAAVGMQSAFRDLAHEQTGVLRDVGLRVAVNTGEVVVSDDHTDVVGDPVNVAAHLQQQVQDGDVLIGESTRRLVGELVTLAPFGALRLKGRSETVAAYRVVSLDRPAGAPATMFVGRDDELRRIATVYDAAVAARSARLAVLLGSPGLGKSRLLAEFTRRLGDQVTVVIARCDAAAGATFAPLTAALRVLLHLDDGAEAETVRAAIETVVPGDEPERSRIADGIIALLAATPASPEETFFVVRRLLGAIAAARPLVLVIDDLQWAEPLLLDLTEHLVQWSSTVPLFVLVAARPELREVRSTLAAPGSLVADVVTLGGLDAGAATRLAANVIGAGELPAAIAGRVLATSEGNPLFVGELVRMLVQDGVLKREGDRWVAGVELAALEMPPTIHALLAARIERLRPEERIVLERAAVVGRHFSRTAVAHLLPREISDLDARLESLRRSELVESDAGWFLGEPALRFHHMLVRDAAYRRLLKETRAELHGRFADWLEPRVAETVEHDETIGWHLEQAHRLLGELGPLDAHARAFGERAAHYLAAAGRRALARDDLPPAASLLGRALDRLDAADPARADLALDWCEALLTAGDVAPAVGAVDELGRFTGASDRLRAWHTCFAGQLAVLTDPAALRATADAVAAAADELASLGDAAGEAKAHSVHALALGRLGRVGACEAALDRALAAARRAHDRRRANAVLAGAPVAALWGPSPVTRASGRCLDVVRVLRITQGAPAVEAVALRCQAVLEALRGRTEAARRMIASSRHMVEELGIMHRLLEADVFAGLIDLLEGDAVAAERGLRVAYDGLREHGLGIDAAQAAALLGRALLALGRAAEAEAVSHEGEALAGDDLKAAIAWRGVRAEALAQRGEHAAAVAFARAAVEIAAATDALLDHADARLALAAALHAAGRGDEADAEEARAIELWEAKGATLLAERARRNDERTVLRTDRIPEDRTEPARSARRRVRPNAATANAARLDAAVAARDADACGIVFADDSQSLHHPTGATYDRRGALAWVCSVFKAEDVTFANEPLATLGDSLALCRLSVSASGVSAGRFDVGASEREQIALIEVDARGQRRRAEFFAGDRLGDAIARLYERYADLLRDGSARTRAATTARSVAVLLGARAADDCATALAPDVEFVDRRPVGFPSAHGAGAFLHRFRARAEVADDIIEHDDDVLGLRSDTLLVRRTTSGTARAGGGRFERPVIFLWVFGSSGLLTRDEWFDVDREAEALARFDELTGKPPAARIATAPSRAGERRDRRVRPNAATAHAARLDTAIATGDAGTLPLLLADQVENVHHPTGVVYDRSGTLAFWHSLLTARDVTFWHEPLATLGDALALCHSLASVGEFSEDAFGPGSAFAPVGPVEVEVIVLIEVDAHGRRVRCEFFAEHHLSDAIARLYERYADLLPDGPARARAAATAHAAAAVLGRFELERYASAFAPALEAVDHRTLGTWSARGADALREHFRSMLELADAAATRDDEILGLQPEAFLVRRTHFGTARAGGGAYERQFLVLWIFGADGLLSRMEWFDTDRDGEALARFDELTAEAPASRFTNAASRSVDRFVRCWRERDWDAAVAMYAPTLVLDDRRGLVGLPVTGEDLIVNLRFLFAMKSSRWHNEARATRGDRLVLSHTRFTGEVGDGAEIVVEFLSVAEFDAAGRYVGLVHFDLEDLEGAYAELDDRYVAGEGAPYAELLANNRAFRQASAARDWDAVARLLPADFTMINHRRFGGTGSRMNRDEYLAWRSSVDDLGIRGDMRVDHVLRISATAGVNVVTSYGTVDGGEFELPFVSVYTHDRSCFHSSELFDLDQLDVALARYDELIGKPRPRVEHHAGAHSAKLRPDPLHIPPNTATRTSDRWQKAVVAEDWESVEVLFASTLVFDDRRHGFLTTGDRQMLLANDRLIGESKPRVSRTVLATAGDRLALRRVSVAGTSAEGAFEEVAFEVDFLQIIEVDEDGRLVAVIAFDPDDRRAASLEMVDRYARSDAGRATHPAGMEFQRALHDHDLERCRAALSDGFVFHDHRRTGAGRIASVDGYIAWLAALFEESADAIVEPLYYVAVEEHGFLTVAHTYGTLAEGGEFESVFVQLALHQGGRPVAAELFEIADLEAARARFEELRPDTLRIVPNAACRVRELTSNAFAASDWAALRALASDDFVFDERRKRALIRGDVELWIENMRVMRASGARLTRELIGTVGDRITLERVVVAGEPDTGAFEIELVLLTEVDAEGRLVTSITFDLDDRSAAFAEAQARFLAGEAAATGGQAPIAVHLRAVAQHDWEALRECVADDAVVHDRRTLGMGELGRDEWIESLRVLVDLAPDVSVEASRVLAWNRHGRVAMQQIFGALRDGGPFENVLVVVMLTSGDRIRRFEFFDVGDAEKALARFAELCLDLP